jgi:hypothetical protein
MGKLPGRSVLLLLILSSGLGSGNEQAFPRLQGPYLGQKPPGMTPELFAPGLIAGIEEHQNCLTFSPDGKEIYWGRYYKGKKTTKFW